jgi:two-component system nitrogen regulation sensor histidine kinase NtrY
LFDSVLSSVTAGVIGLDARGRIDFMNRSARTLLGTEDGPEGAALSEAVPEFAALFASGCARGGALCPGRGQAGPWARVENLLVRIATRRAKVGSKAMSSPSTMSPTWSRPAHGRLGRCGAADRA